MKKIIIAILFLSATLTVFAQGHEKKDQIKALKIAYITDRLDLTTSEAQKFWPIYNTYNETIRTLRHEVIRSIRRDVKQNYNTLTTEKATELLKQLTEAETSIHNETILLTEQLKTVISSKKILLLKIAEDEFNRKLLGHMRKRYKGNKN